MLVFAGLDVITKPECLGQTRSGFEPLRRNFPRKGLMPENTNPSSDLYREPMTRFSAFDGAILQGTFSKTARSSGLWGWH